MSHTLRPTHHGKNFIARRWFAGRHDECTAFDQALREAPDLGRYQVLMWYGVGGQGKSTLLREFVRIAERFNQTEAAAGSGKEVRLARIDFDDERLKRIDSALYAIRSQLAQESGISFLTFDAAFVSYYRKTRPGIDVAAEFPELFKGDSEALAALFDLLGSNLTIAAELTSVALPGAGLLYKWGSRLTGSLKKWWIERGNRMLADIDALTPEELLQRLPSFLGVDLCAAIASRPSVRPVIMLDTYEALWRERGQKDASMDRRADAWVRLLVQDCPGALFVIAGRDRLRWDQLEPVWASVIDASLLGGLSNNDADRFLRAIPVDEAAIRERIVDSSHGLPFYLDLQASQYESIRDQGLLPSIDHFGRRPVDLLPRFLEHLSDADQAALRMASYVNPVTRTDMHELAEAFPGRLVNFRFESLVARSAFVDVGNDAYAIHMLMRDELQCREQEEHPAFFVRVHRHLHDVHHQWLLAITDERGVSQDVPIRFEAAFEHLSLASPVEAIDWLLTYQGWFKRFQVWEAIERMHRKALLMSSTVSQRTRVLPYILNNLAVVLDQVGRPGDASHFLEQLLAGSDRRDGSSIVVTAHYNLGQLHCGRGQYSKAEEQFRAALELLASTRSAPDARLFSIHAALGECLYLQSSFQDALTAFTQAVRMAHDAGLGAHLATGLHLLAEGYQAVGRYDVAIPLFQASLEQFAPEHAPSPTEVANRSMDEMQGDCIWRPRLITRLVDRIHVNGFAALFECRDDSWTSGPQGASGAELRRSILALLSQQTEPDFSVIALSPFEEPAAEACVASLTQELSRTEVGKMLVRAREAGRFTIRPLKGDGLDFGVDTVNRKLWISVPAATAEAPTPKLVAMMVYSLREIDQHLINLVPDPAADAQSFATALHACALDACMHVARFVNESVQVERLALLAIMSPEARELTQAAGEGAEPPRLFDLYVKMLERSSGTKCLAAMSAGSTATLFPVNR